MPFMLLAGLGFILSLLVHLASLAGVSLPFGRAVFLLHLGLFVVWIPTVFAASRISKGAPRRDVWKVALSGCPRWLRVSIPAVFIYALINFVIFAATNVSSKGKRNDTDPSVVRGFSGHWLVFYSAAFAVMYSIRNRPSLLQERRCPTGHVVSATAQYCGACGQHLGPWDNDE